MLLARQASSHGESASGVCSRMMSRNCWVGRCATASSPHLTEMGAQALSIFVESLVAMQAGAERMSTHFPSAPDAQTPQPGVLGADLLAGDSRCARNCKPTLAGENVENYYPK